MVAKWVADALESNGVYDLAQTVLGHPFLDLDHSVKLVQRRVLPCRRIDTSPADDA